PWIGTPELSVHHRLLKPILEAHGVTQNIVAQVDQESSMLEMVRSGIGLSLSRDSIALEQRHSAGLSICPDIDVPASVCFVMHDNLQGDPVKKALAATVMSVWSLDRVDAR
ncbi:MAG: LysR family transcriptional regulator substrate-binding protein, partial [Pseudomonadota bacterium]